MLEDLKDKGTFYLVDMFKNYLRDYNLTIVGNDKSLISKKYFLIILIIKILSRILMN